MKAAIKSFLLMTGLVLIIAFFGWSYLRYRALSTPPKPPIEHAFLKELGEFSIIAYPDPAHASNLGFLEEAAKLSTSVILWINVRPRIEDGTLVLARDPKETPEAPTLTEALERISQHRLIINVQGHRPGLIPNLISIIEKASASDRILIQSPEDGFLSEMRAERPLWLYGTSLAQVTQLIMLSSIGLQPVAPLRGDVLVVENEDVVGRLNDRALGEAIRRGMKIFAGPMKNKEQATEFHKRGVNGVLISDPSLISELLQSTGA